MAYNFSKQIILKHKILNDNRFEEKIICYYRYISWFVTSLFYLFEESKSDTALKLEVIFMLFLSIKIFFKIYAMSKNNLKLLTLIIIIEMLGITFLLLPTGGLKSPFTWYALNYVLISAIYLPVYMCWVNLVFYITSCLFITHLYFHDGKISKLFTNNTYMVIVFVLITLLVQLFSIFSKQLRSQFAVSNKQNKKLAIMNSELYQANKRYLNLMEQIMSLYKAVEALSGQENEESLMKVVTEYACKLTGINSSFFWMASYNNEKITLSNESDEIDEGKLSNFIKEKWNELRTLKNVFSIKIFEKDYYGIVVKSNSKYFGILAIKKVLKTSNTINIEKIKQLSFLSELSAVILERFDQDKIYKKLVILEEQNRIANEIHDSVSQRLFTIVCAVRVLSLKWNDMDSVKLQQQLDMIHQSSQKAMEEIRIAIYSLSSIKREEKEFLCNIEEFLNEFSSLNNIEIGMELKGDEQLLSSSLKRALYRIICEASGNSVRHGQCDRLKVKCSIKDTFTELNITDNGKGFTENNLCRKEKIGLGINNMKNLVKSFNGEFVINSEKGKKTEINIIIPNENYSILKKEE